MNSTEKDFCEEFKNKLFELVGKDPKVIVAFSGGCDSLGLLLLCSKVLPHSSIKAVYVNHNLRSPSELEAEEELNCLNCDALHIELIIREIPKFKVEEYSEEQKCGTEAAARVLRYRILEEERINAGFDWILTAHHLDDQIETVYMKKMQNSPVTSLRGISEITGNVVRPLLSFTRDKIKDFVSMSQLSYSTDSTNSDNSFFRNKIRNEIIPLKKEENQDFCSEILSIRNEAVKQCEGFEFCTKNYLDLSYFNNLSEAQKNLCLFDLWDRVVGTSRGLSKSLIERLINVCLRNENKIVESNDGCFDIYNGKVYLSKVSLNKDFSAFSRTIEDFSEGSVSLLEGRTLLWGNKAPEILTKDDLILSEKLFTGKVIIRYVRLGDRIELKDGSKTVLRLLQNLKVPPSLRFRVPVLVDEDGLCGVFASSFGSRNRIAKKFCNKEGSRFVLHVLVDTSH